MPRLIALALALAACTATPIPALDPGPAVPEPSVRGERIEARDGFRARRALDDVRTIARMGPREATTDVYERAARFVEGRLDELGYEVTRQYLDVPAGVSWGIPVRGGETFNVIARPRTFEPARPWVVVGAHLDTVPQAPGADDNASGVAMMLELARLAARRPPRTQAVFIAFAAEEPRAGGDDGHHYGSRAFMRRLDEERAATLIGAMSLDRVGVGRDVRVCTGGLGSGALADVVLARAGALGVGVAPCANRASDHWSFERAGFDGVRLLGEDHDAYHTAGDLPRVVSGAQLARIGSLAWAALRRF